jgi:hypothetical protein
MHSVSLIVPSPVGSQAPEAADPEAAGGFDDGLGALYTAISDLQQEGVAAGNTLVQQDEATESQEQAAQQAALQRAQSDQPSSGGGFFACVGRACGDFLDDVVHGHVLQAFSDAGHDLAQGWDSPHLWSDLGKILTDVSIASEVASDIAPLLGPLAAPVAAVAQGAAGVAAAGQGLVHLRTGQFAADAQDAQADATLAQDRLALVVTQEHDSLTNLSDQSQTLQGALAAATQAIETCDETRVGAATFRIRG